jgi:cytochrome oxidase Cu insertion factor (SCO1/SenC/PrrC family)
VLADLRQILAQDFGRSVRLISISIEPEKDDVPAIAEYAAQFRTEATDADTPEWVFLTGEPETIRTLRRKLGYYDIDDEVDRDPTQHAAALIVGNQATGRWGIMPVGLGAERLANKVRTLAGWTSAQRYGVADRPAVPQGDRAGNAAASDSEPPISTAPSGTTPAATAAPTTE